MIKEYQVAAGVMAFSTTRKGGVSQGNYGEFNINEYCGDFAEHVAENRKRLATELGIDTAHIIMPHQVHGVEVRNIAGEFLTMPENIRKMVLEGVDAVMTDQKGVCIGVSTADCIPVLFMMRSIMLWLPSMPAGVVRWLASCIKPFRRWRLPIIPTRRS